jgi:hypothetical protein
MPLPFSSEDQLGPLFKVEEAGSSWLGPNAKGWIVTLRGQDLAIWTGGFMTLHDAGERLLNHHLGLGQTP